MNSSADLFKNLELCIFYLIILAGKGCWYRYYYALKSLRQGDAARVWNQNLAVTNGPQQRMFINQGGSYG
eukprot:gene21896-28344_t